MVLEKKALKQSILKNLLLGNLKKVKNLRKIYKRIVNNQQNLVSLRNKLIKDPHVFLNI